MDERGIMAHAPSRRIRATSSPDCRRAARRAAHCSAVSLRPDITRTSSGMEDRSRRAMTESLPCLMRKLRRSGGVYE